MPRAGAGVRRPLHVQRHAGGFASPPLVMADSASLRLPRLTRKRILARGASAVLAADALLPPLLHLPSACARTPRPSSQRISRTETALPH